MKIEDAYKALTAQAKRRAEADIDALLRLRGKATTDNYLKQVLYGHRVCGEDIARVVAGYFSGVIGLDVSVEDVRGPENVVPPHG